MKHPSFFIVFFAFFLFSCTSVPQQEITTTIERETISVNTKKNEDAIVFEEIWAYVLDGKEETLSNSLPITDVGYFGAEISHRGFLTGVPDAKEIAFYDGRVHLVAVCNHYGMTHMMLNPEYPFREKLINDLLYAIEKYNYDGLQIDYELILAVDEDNFISFLEELNKRLKQLPPTAKVDSRIFSVAVPARTRYLSEDAFDYKRISATSDKVFVMAYDEHWSGGTPGPVASFSWGKNVASYSLDTIGAEKLVMGQPFYGRTWGDINGNKAYFHSGMARQINEFEVNNLVRTENILSFSYTVPLTITGYFDDAESIKTRSIMYRDMKINKTGFWCLGQEDPKVWQNIAIMED